MSAEHTADWLLEPTDCLHFQGQTTMDEAFTVVIVVFVDAVTGDERTVTAETGQEKYGEFVKLVRTSARMSVADAQALADDAAAVLGGGPPHRYWATLSLDRQVTHRTGAQRPASEIAQGDTFTISIRAHQLLHLFATTRNPDVGTVDLQLADADLGARLDMESRLLHLESGE